MKFAKIASVLFLVIFLQFLSMNSFAVSFGVDLENCKKHKCTWKHGDGTIFRGCDNHKHTYTEAGTYYPQVTMECEKLTETTTKKIKIVDNTNSESYPQCQYSNKTENKYYFSTDKYNMALGSPPPYNVLAYWDNSKVCDYLSYKTTEDNITACINNEYHYYFVGSDKDETDTNMYKICRVPVNECKYTKEASPKSYVSIYNGISEGNKRTVMWEGDIKCSSSKPYSFAGDPIPDHGDCIAGDYKYYRTGSSIDSEGDMETYTEEFYKICREKADYTQ